MRPLFLLCLGASAAVAAPFSLGVKAGVPLTDFFSTVQSPNFGFNSSTNRYIVGGSAELHLPLGLGIEFDALYRHLNYTATANLVDVFTSSRTTGNAWEFPLLLKYRFLTPVIKPYVDAGVAWDTLTGLKQTVTRLSPVPIGLSSTSNPTELRHDTTTGFVLGVGLDVHAIFLHILPEIRYTRWGSQHFLSANGGLESNQNQAEFLLGINF